MKNQVFSSYLSILPKMIQFFFCIIIKFKGDLRKSRKGDLYITFWTKFRLNNVLFLFRCVHYFNFTNLPVLIEWLLGVSAPSWIDLSKKSIVVFVYTSSNIWFVRLQDISASIFNYEKYIKCLNFTSKYKVIR